MKLSVAKRLRGQAERHATKASESYLPTVPAAPFRAPNLGTGYGSTPVRQLPRKRRSIRKYESTATRRNRRRGAGSVVGTFMNGVAAPVGEDGSSVRCAVLGPFIRYLYTYFT